MIEGAKGRGATDGLCPSGMRGAFLILAVKHQQGGAPSVGGQTHTNNQRSFAISLMLYFLSDSLFAGIYQVPLPLPFLSCTHSSKDI